MADLLMVVVIAAFFVLAATYVRLCDRVIGPDPLESEPQDLAVAGHEPIPGHIDHDGDAEVDRAVRVGR